MPATHAIRGIVLRPTHIFRSCPVSIRHPTTSAGRNSLFDIPYTNTFGQDFFIFIRFILRFSRIIRVSWYISS